MAVTRNTASRFINLSTGRAGGWYLALLTRALRRELAAGSVVEM